MASGRKCNSPTRLSLDALISRAVEIPRRILLRYRGQSINAVSLKIQKSVSSETDGNSRSIILMISSASLKSPKASLSNTSLPNWSLRTSLIATREIAPSVPRGVDDNIRRRWMEDPLFRSFGSPIQIIEFELSITKPAGKLPCPLASSHVLMTDPRNNAEFSGPGCSMANIAFNGPCSIAKRTRSYPVPSPRRRDTARYVQHRSQRFLNDWKASAAVKNSQNYEAQSINFVGMAAGATYS